MRVRARSLDVARPSSSNASYILRPACITRLGLSCSVSRAGNTVTRCLHATTVQ